MDSDRKLSSIDGILAAERQPLLPSPLSVDGHPNGNTVIDTEVVAAGHSSINVLLEIRTKLAASALNFFLGGIAMAAVGVSTAPLSPVTPEAR